MMKHFRVFRDVFGKGFTVVEDSMPGGAGGTAIGIVVLLGILIASLGKTGLIYGGIMLVSIIVAFCISEGLNSVCGVSFAASATSYIAMLMLNHNAVNNHDEIGRVFAVFGILFIVLGVGCTGTILSNTDDIPALQILGLSPLFAVICYAIFHKNFIAKGVSIQTLINIMKLRDTSPILSGNMNWVFVVLPLLTLLPLAVLSISLVVWIFGKIRG
jgi:hypothetical protein